MSLARLALIGLALAPLTAAAQEPAKKIDRPQVEVVFCLDTTGSMSGLINAAKQKIWAISNQIASGKPTPAVKIGLVAYRDRSDAYVTKVFDLTDDLDAMHGHLMGLSAGGGGDFPESVNQALHEAVTKITWSGDKKTLRMVFLVGDAPPHMDYADDVKYADTCKKAVERDIAIHAVQCGNHAETKKYWEEICRLAEGSYVQLDAKGGPVVAVATPFDADLAKINRELAGSTLTFGGERKQAAAKADATAAAGLAPGAAGDRAAYFARNGGGSAADLLQNVKDGKVKLETLKKAELPPELRELDAPAQKAFLEKLDQRRGELSKEALDLNAKRNAFIAKKQAEDESARPRDSFDNQVLRVLQRQAARGNVVQYAHDEEKKK